MRVAVGHLPRPVATQANSCPSVCIVIGCGSVDAQLAGRSTRDYTLTTDEFLARQRAIFLLGSVPNLPADEALTLCVCSPCFNHAKKRATTQPGDSPAGTLSDAQLTQLAFIEYVLGRVLPHMSPRVAYRILTALAHTLRASQQPNGQQTATILRSLDAAAEFAAVSTFATCTEDVGLKVALLSTTSSMKSPTCRTWWQVHPDFVPALLSLYETQHMLLAQEVTLVYTQHARATLPALAAAAAAARSGTGTAAGSGTVDSNEAGSSRRGSRSSSRAGGGSEHSSRSASPAPMESPPLTPEVFFF